MTSTLRRWAALGSLLVLAGTVGRAQIIYHSFGGPLTVGAGQSVYFNVITGGASGSTPGMNFGIDMAATDTPEFLYNVASSGSSIARTGSFGQHLNANDVIDAALTYFNSGSFAALNSGGSNDTNWPSGTTGYVGLRLDAGGGNFYYGWAQVTYNVGSFSLIDVAYQSTPNTSILAGATAIPEPAPLAALCGVVAMGAALRWRRCRNRAVAA
jgi:hypothetical protein